MKIASPSIRRISQTEVPAVAAFLADNFGDSVVYAGIFTDEKTRKERLTWLFKKNLLLQNAAQDTWIMVNNQGIINNEESQIIAAITYLPSSEKRSSITDYIKVGLLFIPFKFGIKVLRNLLNANDFNEASVYRAAGESPYWYLSMVAVGAAHRRKGIAGQLINAVIQNGATRKTFDAGYTSVLLTTQLESNVSLYLKLGFHIVDTNEDAGYTIWTMKKLLFV